MNKIEIVKKDLSPLWIKIVGVLIFLATAYKMVTMTFFQVNPLVYIILNLMAVAIWTGKEIVTIDTRNGEIGNGFRMMGLSYLDKTKFSGIEKVFIKKVRTLETFRHMATTTDIRHEHYKAFLKTNEGKKICIGIHTDKDKLINRLKEYNKDLKTTIFDNTFHEPTVILHHDPIR